MPPTLRFVMDGEMPDYLLAKDLILQVCFSGYRCFISDHLSAFLFGTFVL